VGPVYANVSATGATEIKQRGVALRAGDIRADQQYLLILNATDDYWELISVPGNPSDRYQSEVVTGTNDYVLTLDPAMTALVDVEKVRFKVPNTNTGNCRLNVSSLGLKSIYKFNTSQTLVNLSPGDLPATGIVECVYTSSSDAYILLTPIPVATVAVIASGRNFVVTNSTVARVTCTADEVILKTTGSTPQIYLASSVSTFADMGATGAGGLDTGAEGASRWYYFWLIYNPSTGMVNGLISESSTAPTLPSGYTYRALLGAVYNDSGSDFDDFYQHQRRAIIPAQAIFNDTTGVTSWTALSGAPLNAIIPPIAKQVSGFAGCTAGAGGAIAVAADGNGTGVQVVSGANTGAGFGEYVVGGCWNVVLKTAQTIYWQAGATTASNFGIQVSGYEI
jgi:hypothetical protein